MEPKNENGSIEVVIAKQSLSLAMQVVLNFIYYTFISFQNKWNKHPHFGSNKIDLLITDEDHLRRVNSVICHAAVDGLWDTEGSDESDKIKSMGERLESAIISDASFLLDKLSPRVKSVQGAEVDQLKLHFLCESIMNFFKVYSGFIEPLSGHFAKMLTHALDGTIDGKLPSIEGKSCLGYLVIVPGQIRSVSQFQVVSALIALTQSFLSSKQIDPGQYVDNIAMAATLTVKEIETEILASSSAG